MRSIVIGVIVGVLLTITIAWLIAFTDRMGFSLESAFEKIFTHAERTADKVLERRKKC